IRMRVSHILLFPDSSRSMAQVKVLADSICTAVKKGADYDSMCRLYSMDGVRNRPQCDLSYFHQGVMVRPFEEAILKHNKGEVFTVQTEFGLHVVKNLEQPIKDRERLTYIMLYVSTRGHVVTNVGYSVFRRK
ncbi:MAG TPA: peptidylprolyl isomerase, partial [Bacteroidia bacterium]|nr:peptidylprolyl isomerase [Bacteroidia bacterium]